MRASKWLVVAALFLLVGGLQVPAFARPGGGFVRGGIGFRGGHFGGFRGGFYGFSMWNPAFPYWGWGWDPWFNGPDVMEYERVNYGTVQFQVKPGSTKVYVDQKYLGTVNQLDGCHHQAYVPGGYHSIKLVAPDGQSAERNIYVPVGQKVKIDEKL